jgi:phosphatidylglycerophosphatase A
MGLSRSVKQIVAESLATLDGPKGIFQIWGQFIRKGKGTFGSLLATPVWLYFSGFHLAWPIYILALVLVTFVGVWAIRIYEKEVGGADLPEVIIDEFVGMGISLFMVPMSVGYVILAFALFRLFDIWKPFGVKFFDDRHLNGWGVMLDDVVAGIYAFLLVQALARSGYGQFLV